MVSRQRLAGKRANLYLAQRLLQIVSTHNQRRATHAGTNGDFFLSEDVFVGKDPHRFGRDRAHCVAGDGVGIENFPVRSQLYCEQGGSSTPARAAKPELKAELDSPAS